MELFFIVGVMSLLAVPGAALYAWAASRWRRPAVLAAGALVLGVLVAFPASNFAHPLPLMPQNGGWEFNPIALVTIWVPTAVVVSVVVAWPRVRLWIPPLLMLVLIAVGWTLTLALHG